MKAKSLGKALISVTAVAQMVGPFVFDFNETHIYNKSWPPQAKFHNVQTMSSGVALSVATLVNLWRPGAGRVGVDAAALSASVYWVSQLSALFYPGTASVDPPGRDNWPQLLSPVADNEDAGCDFDDVVGDGVELVYLRC